MTDRPPFPVACSLSEPALAKRRAGLFTDLAQRRQEVRWLPEGVTLRYSSEQGTLKASAARSCGSSSRSSPDVEPSGSS